DDLGNMTQINQAAQQASSAMQNMLFGSSSTLTAAQQSARQFANQAAQSSMVAQTSLSDVATTQHIGNVANTAVQDTVLTHNDAHTATHQANAFNSAAAGANAVNSGVAAQNAVASQNAANSANTAAAQSANSGQTGSAVTTGFAPGVGAVPF